MGSVFLRFYVFFPVGIVAGGGEMAWLGLAWDGLVVLLLLLWLCIWFGGGGEVY